MEKRAGCSRYYKQYAKNIKKFTKKLAIRTKNNFKVSVKDILKKVTRKTKVILLANPNNPTGTYVAKKDLIFLRKKLRSNILLVVEDAYFEFRSRSKDIKNRSDRDKYTKTKLHAQIVAAWNKK